MQWTSFFPDEELVNNKFEEKGNEKNRDVKKKGERKDEKVSVSKWMEEHSNVKKVNGKMK